MHHVCEVSLLKLNNIHVDLTRNGEILYGDDAGQMILGTLVVYLP